MWFQSTTKDRQCVIGSSLHEGPERARGPEGSLYEAVEVKPALHWRPQDIGHAMGMRQLPKRATQRRVRPKSQSKEMYVAGSKVRYISLVYIRNSHL